MQQLNTQQIKAVTASDGPILVLAGAGSGKTRVLTNRILYLVKERGISPYNILAITFTNKAANEMKNRLLEFDPCSKYMHISTIHSFCATVLRSEAESINRRTNFSIYSEDDKKTVIKRIAKETSDDFDGKIVDGISEIISQLKNDAEGFLEFCMQCNSQDEVHAYLQNISDPTVQKKIEKMMDNSSFIDAFQFVKIIGDYQSKMSENNAFDFDDLLFYTHKLFRSCPNVLSKYQEQFKYICIDEFQDINKVQYEIFKMLASKYQNIFVVGDDDQSIYSWRGAEIANILNFNKDFNNAQVFKLEQNYRSTKRILDVANSLISPNIGRFEKKLWTENESGVRVELFRAFNESDEAYYVLKNIEALHYQNGYAYKDFAILMRINALSRSFEMECRKAGIPYRVFGGFKFFDRKEIKDILAYLNLILNPFDTVALFRVMNVPQKRGIGEATINKLRQFSAENGLSVIEIISDERNMQFLHSGTRQKLSDFYSLYNDLCELSKLDSLGVFVHKLLQILQFRDAYLNGEDEDRAINIDEFEQSVLDFAESYPEATLKDFMQSVSLATDKEGGQAETDYVTIATIHAVKGLEFKTVFVVGNDEGIFPSSRSFDRNSMEEERRLMYVATTRACKRLYLTHASSRFLYGMRKNLIPGKYFKEVFNLVSPKQVTNFGVERVYTDDFSQKLPTVDRPASSKGKPDSEIRQFKAGQLVVHDTFGKGMILMCRDGIADIVFDQFGKKSLNIKFAPLKILK